MSYTRTGAHGLGSSVHGAASIALDFGGSGCKGFCVHGVHWSKIIPQHKDIMCALWTGNGWPMAGGRHIVPADVRAWCVKRQKQTKAKNAAWAKNRASEPRQPKCVPADVREDAAAACRKYQSASIRGLGALGPINLDIAAATLASPAPTVTALPAGSQRPGAGFSPVAAGSAAARAQQAAAENRAASRYSNGPYRGLSPCKVAALPACPSLWGSLTSAFRSKPKPGTAFRPGGNVVAPSAPRMIVPPALRPALAPGPLQTPAQKADWAAKAAAAIIELARHDKVAAAAAVVDLASQNKAAADAALIETARRDKATADAVIQTVQTLPPVLPGSEEAALSDAKPVWPWLLLAAAVAGGGYYAHKKGYV